MSELISAVFDIFGGKSRQFVLKRYTACKCSSSDIPIVSPGILNKSLLISWACMHTEPKSKCPLGIFFRQLGSPKSRFLRMYKYLQHDHMLSHDWKLMICGISYVDEIPQTPLIQEPTPAFTEDSHNTNQIMVPQVVARDTLRTRNKERGNANAVDSIRPFLPRSTPPSNSRISNLNTILSSYHELFMNICFQNRIKAIENGVPLHIYDEKERVLVRQINIALHSLLMANKKVNSFDFGGLSNDLNADNYIPTDLPDSNLPPPVYNIPTENDLNP